MSRIGNSAVKKPGNVTVTKTDGFLIVNGPKGELKQSLLPGIKINEEDDNLIVARSNDEPAQKAKHGLMRSLLQNMVTGVTEGFEKKLEINGVGFRVNLAGSDLKMSLGYSHEVTYKIPEGITAKVDQNTITVSGIDKQQVGQVAAEIRALRKPEPYKGKGIKYTDERIMRKSGKSGKEKA